jgi:hypothetical protein
MTPEHNSSTKPLTQIGEGVPRRDEPTEAEEKTEEELKWEQEQPGIPKWSKAPTFSDHYINPKYRGTWKMGPRIFKTFALPEQEAELNKLQAKAHPPEAPEIVINTKEQAFEGRWSILAVYHEISYKILLKPEP